MAIIDVAARGEGMAATDGTLVNGVLNGDRAAFAELYDRRARLIRAICFDVTHDLDAAAELTQEVFCRAHARLWPQHWLESTSILSPAEPDGPAEASRAQRGGGTE